MFYYEKYNIVVKMKTHDHVAAVYGGKWAACLAAYKLADKTGEEVWVVRADTGEVVSRN